MLDDLPVLIEPEDINAGQVMFSWPLLAAMQHDIVSFRNDAFDLDALARIFLRRLLEVGDEAVFSSAAPGMC